MAITLKHKIFAILALIALLVIMLPMWIHDASRLKIKLWSLPNKPAIPDVVNIDTLPAITLLTSESQKYNPEAWIIRVKTFAEPEQAEKLVTQLRSAGLVAYQETIINSDAANKLAGSTVYVGPELTKANLQRAIKILQQTSQIKGDVVTFSVMTAH